MRTTYRRVLAVTGAGISTDSGVPDFRGPQGIWTTNPTAVRSVTRKDFLADRQVRCDFWQMCRGAYERALPAPNSAHHALVDLEQAGRLIGIVTQNVDRLHQDAGSSPALVHEVHGTMATTSCLRCGLRVATAEVVARVREGEAEPLCLFCGGTIKPDTVFFGDHLDRAVFGRAVALAAMCDLVLAVGSSLCVEPAAGLCATAVETGADLVVVNAEETPYDGFATEIVREPIGTALPRLVAELVAA